MTLEEIIEANRWQKRQLLNASKEASIQLWERQYKELLSRQHYLPLDTILDLFLTENKGNAAFKVFEEETYFSVNTVYSLLERAEKYKLLVPEIAMYIVCATCVCGNCHINCSGYSCDECRARYGRSYSSYCDD